MEDYLRSNNMRVLVAFLNRLPASRVLSTSEDDGNEVAERAALFQRETGLDVEPATSERWWVKLRIDIRLHMAWHVIQELGHVLNYVSLDERLPTVFKPTSSPPYLNGGPDDYLGWVIESTAEDVDPAYVAEVLEGHLPRPPEDVRQWARCSASPCDVPGDDDEGAAD